MNQTVWIAAIAFLLSLPAIAAEYRGQVTFNSLPLPGATVTARQGDKAVSAISDAQGAFSFPDMGAGVWSLEVEKPGFTPIKKDLAVGTGLPGPALEMTMLPIEEMGAPAVSTPAPAAAAAATVTAAAPAAPPVPAAAGPAVAPSPGASGKAAKKAATPPTASTPFQRTDLNAAASAPDLSADSAPAATSELNQRAADGFLINGSTNNGSASPFGQLASFGNNRRRGYSLYTYALSLVDSNSALNAASYSLTGQATPKPAFNNMTGTFSVGGPLKIPHLIEQRNAPQMTFQYTRVENRTPQVATGLMPTLAERAGDFSQALYAGKAVTLYDPTSGNPLPGNQLPSISPQALSLLKYYPAPNFSGSSVYNYQIPIVGNTHTDSMNLRLSRNFLRRNYIQGALAISDTRGDSNNIFGFLNQTRSRGINSSISLRRTFGSRFFGTFTYQFSRNSNRLAPYFSDRLNVSGLAGIEGNNQSPLYWGPPSLGFNQSQISGLSDAIASVTHNQTDAISFQGTWSRGRHNASFGGDFRWQQFNTLSQTNPRGTFTFNGAATGLITNGVATPGTGFDFADFLSGIPDTSAIAFGNADKYLRSKQPDVYAQDDWRVSPAFTLNLGLRWEFTSPLTEKYGRLVNLDVAPGFAAIAPVLATGPNALRGSLTGMSYPASLIRPYYDEFQPRLAFAWRPSARSSLVLRGGYGIAYNTQIYQPFVTRMEQQSPLSTALSVANTAAAPLTLASGFYAPPNTTTTNFAADPNLKPGYVQAWNLALQRDLPFSLQMAAAYSGNKGTHQLQAFAPNTYPSGAVSPCPNCPSGFAYYTSGANSERQAGIFQLRRRLHNGFQAQAQYTYAKAIDDAASLGGGGLGGLAQNWLDLRGERGPSASDQRHLLNLSLQYTTGMGVKGGTLLGGWRGLLVKDWTFLSTINLGSGLPLTPIYASIIPGTALNGMVRAEYTGASLYAAPAGYYLNPEAVAAPPPGQWGNAGMRSMRGPDQFSMGASMQRSFRLGDRFTLNARIDANNPLNHVAVTGVNAIITSPQFGYPSQVNGMRTVTTTMRLTF